MLHESMRVSRWKTTVDPDMAVHFARHLVTGTDVDLPDDAAPNANELAGHINACKAVGAEFITASQADYAYELAEFISQATTSTFAYAVDLWRLTYGDETHVAASVVSQTENHNLLAHRTAAGRVYGNHLIAASQNISWLSAYSATRREYDSSKPQASSTAEFLLDPATCPQYAHWCLTADDIERAVHVRTLRGPDLDDECWARTEPGRDINLDTTFPSGVVHGVYNITAR